MQHVFPRDDPWINPRLSPHKMSLYGALGTNIISHKMAKQDGCYEISASLQTAKPLVMSQKRACLVCGHFALHSLCKTAICHHAPTPNGRTFQINRQQAI